MLGHFSLAELFATLWTTAHQALLSMGFCRREYTGEHRPIHIWDSAHSFIHLIFIKTSAMGQSSSACSRYTSEQARQVLCSERTLIPGRLPPDKVKTNSCHQPGSSEDPERSAHAGSLQLLCFTHCLFHQLHWSKQTLHHYTIRQLLLLKQMMQILLGGKKSHISFLP